MSKIPVVLVPPNTNVSGGVMSRNFGMFSDLVVVGSGVAATQVAGGVLPYSYDEYAAAMIAALGSSPEAWYQLNKGQTVTGSGVSTWADQSGNGRDLLQAVDGSRPPLQADGSVLFDGVADFLKASAFTLNQPWTCYMLGKSIVWTLNATFFDGNTNAVGAVYMSAASPNIRQFAGLATTENANMPIGSYALITSVFNGASSTLQVNNTTAVTSDAGASNAAGFTIGAAGGGAVQFANIQVKEVMVFAGAHNATQQATVKQYLNSVGGLTQ